MQRDSITTPSVILQISATKIYFQHHIKSYLRRRRDSSTSTTICSSESFGRKPQSTTASQKCQKRSEPKSIIQDSLYRWNWGRRVSQDPTRTSRTRLISSLFAQSQFRLTLKSGMRLQCKLRRLTWRASISKSISMTWTESKMLESRGQWLTSLPRWWIRVPWWSPIVASL